MRDAGYIVRAEHAAIALALIAATMLAACATPVAPDVERMQAARPPLQASAQNKNRFVYSILRVGEVTGEANAGNVQSIRDALWLAMCESLEKSGIFRAVITNGKAEYRLDAIIVSHRELTTSMFVQSSDLTVRYRLTDLASNKVAWRQSFATHGDAGDLTAANESAVRQNLTRMIDRLAASSVVEARAN